MHFEIFEKKKFRLIYNVKQHIDVHKNYLKIVNIVYISLFLRKIHVFVKYYSIC